jgi:hypothetical protein
MSNPSLKIEPGGTRLQIRQGSLRVSVSTSGHFAPELWGTRCAPQFFGPLWIFCDFIIMHSSSVTKGGKAYGAH